LHVEHVVNPDEAAVVVRIFELAATGAGYRKIAITLNDERVISPPPRGTGRPRAWAASTIREILHREQYRGEIVWNQKRKRDQWGLKKYETRPEADWLRASRPDLQIVSDKLWNDVQERLRGSQQIYLRTNGGRLWGRPANGIDLKYLLTGLLECGACRGSLTVTSGDWKTRRRFAYACSHNRFRGATVCANNLWSPMESTDGAVLEAFKRQLLDPVVVEESIVGAIAALRPSTEEADSRRSKLGADLARVQQELSRLTEAIIAGGALPPLVAAVRTESGSGQRWRPSFRRSRGSAMLLTSTSRRSGASFMATSPSGRRRSRATRHWRGRCCGSCFAAGWSSRPTRTKTGATTTSEDTERSAKS
jgi:hypothetical protein